MQDGMHIDVGQELVRLKKTLREAKRKIMFRAEVATVKNCRKLVRRRQWMPLVTWTHTQPPTTE